MRVFATRDFVDGKIPRKENFPMALERFEEACVHPYIDSLLVSAFPYGSFSSPNVTSDLDYLLITKDTSLHDCIRSCASSIYNEFHIPVQFNVWEEACLRGGVHTIDLSFQEHLRHSVQKHGYHGEHPFDIISSNGVSLHDSICQSVASYHKRMTDRFLESGFSKSYEMRYLRNSLQNSFHVMRVMVQYFEGSLGDDYEDTTEFVVQRYLEAVDHPDLQRDVEDIFGAAFYYKDFVSQRNGHLADTPPEDLSHMYESLLSDLMPVASTGRSFIQKNASIVAQVRK